MSVEARAKKIKLLVLDVDGVLTDGGLYYHVDGSVIKRFHVQDGLGIKMAQAAGLNVAVITGLSSKAVASRMTELGIKEYHSGQNDKLPVILEITQRHGLDLTEVAYMGDDWVDAGPMSRVGLALAVVNAQPEIKALAHWLSTVPGGHGAVREAIRFILSVQDRYIVQWRGWLP